MIGIIFLVAIPILVHLDVSDISIVHPGKRIWGFAALGTTSNGGTSRRWMRYSYRAGFLVILIFFVPESAAVFPEG